MSKLSLQPKTSSVDPASPGAPVRFTWAGLKRSTIFYPFIGLVAVCIVMAFASNSFFSAANIENIAPFRSSATVFSMTFTKDSSSGAAPGGNHKATPEKPS